MTKIAIVTGSTRPGPQSTSRRCRLGSRPGAARTDAEFELVDIADFNLPLLDEAYPAAYQNYQNAHTMAWSAKIAEFDGFIFVTAEYNHTVAPALANALSYLNAEFKTRQPASSPTAPRSASAPLSTCAASCPNCRSPTCRRPACSPCSPTSRTSPSSSRPNRSRSPAPVLDQLIPWTKAMESVRAAAVAAN